MFQISLKQCPFIMEKVLVLLLVALTVAYAVPDPRGIIINLDAGELCLNSVQCKSKCCHRETGLSLARCAPKASENSECSAWPPVRRKKKERRKRRTRSSSCRIMAQRWWRSF
ncbi:colipase isoform X5 [Vicugna pacos]|uniref:Colipase isoform X5 n=1 Tax=Vicugna pacos TaxID=30538 RepID=A0ABM5BXW5_VICPA